MIPRYNGGVDEMHGRIDHALSLRGKKRKADESKEETWSAIKNSASAAKLTEEVIRPMFMVSPPKTVDKDGDLEALGAMSPRSKRRKPQSKRILYSPFYPFKILRSSPRKANNQMLTSHAWFLLDIRAAP